MVQPGAWGGPSSKGFPCVDCAMAPSSGGCDYSILDGDRLGGPLHLSRSLQQRVVYEIPGELVHLRTSELHVTYTPSSALSTETIVSVWFG